jgi:hypothetical protein
MTKRNHGLTSMAIKFRCFALSKSRLGRQPHLLGK